MNKLTFYIVATLVFISSCKKPSNTKTVETKEKKSNRLINESSPYLLQHAYNPVDWYPWGDEAFDKAKKEDKPVIVSIGYSSCHWCHVMEHESFEKEDVAKVMNEHFVCIKVDREERPDVDQTYMDALQSMGLGGGWPLNAIVTPEGKPFYGGTYFPKERWINVLQHLSKSYKEKKEKILESADEVTKALQVSDAKRYGLSDTGIVFNEEGLKDIYQKFSKHFDKVRGGTDKEPKFPMPGNYLFLLRYFEATGDSSSLQQIKVTLDHMALGGIYDQVGGGFARYSTDSYWFAPHFEKMLYDNGQLVSLYAEAYNLTEDPYYLQIVEETLEFTKREMTSPEGAFYSALDADSEGEEGKFYTWEYDELKELLEDDMELFDEIYSIKPGGNWEATNILHRTKRDEQIAAEKGLSLKELQTKIEDWKNKLLSERNKRIRPGLDDKTILGWNALMLKGYSDAYAVTGSNEYINAATKNADFIMKEMRDGEGYHHNWKNGKAYNNGFMDDYSLFCDALISLYQTSQDEKYLLEAGRIANYVIEHFYDETEGLFFFQHRKKSKLITNKKELFDNVIPGCNSVMADNLHKLSLLLYNDDFERISKKMIGLAKKMIFREPVYLSRWSSLYAAHTSGTAEVSIIGPESAEFINELNKEYIPNKVIAATNNSSEIPILKDKSEVQNKTTVYVCYNKACKRPVHSVVEAVELIKHSVQ